MAEYYGSLEGVLDANETLEGEIDSHDDMSGEIQFSGGVGGVKDVKVNGESVVDENKVAHIDLTPYAEKEDVYDKQTIDTALEGKADTDDIPTDLSDLQDDSDHRLVTDEEKTEWSGKADTSDIPTALSQLDNDDNYVQDADYVHTDNNFTDDDKAAIGGIPENITDLSDVEVSNIQNGQVLKWDATQEKFVNANESGGGSGDVADVKVNGTSVVDPVTKEANIDLTGYAETSDIPTDLADLSDDATHRLVTDTEKSTWDNKADVSDIPTVNNNTITIQKNGQNVDSFTLNQNSNKAINIAVPTKTSDLQNDDSFITNTVNNLANYYLKSDTYTQTEVNNLISAAVNGRFEKVTTLPASGEPNVIYLVPKTTALTNNVYDEYIWQDNTWELLGSTEIDLSNYVTTTDLSTALADYVTSSTFNTTIANYYTKTEVGNLLDGKVDKVSGKGLSTYDYDNTAKGKVDTLGTASTKNVPTSGDAGNNEVVLGNDTRLTDARPASDVSAWAKESTKPSYTKSEVGLGNVDNTSDSTKKTNFTGSIASGDTGFTTGGDVYTALGGKADKVSGATDGHIAGLDANGNLTDSGLAATTIVHKADKVSGQVAGHLASLSGTGNLADSGWNGAKDTTSISGNPISISGLKANQLAVNPIITFEPIQAGSGTPSPSNVRAISGYDKVEVLSCGKNIFNKDDASSIIKGYISSTIVAGDAMRTVFVKCKPNTTYTVSKTAGQRFTVAYTKELPAIGITVYGSIANNTASSISITTGADAKYVVGYVFNGSNDSRTADQMIASVQIEESASATTYVPYNKATSISESLGQTVYGGSLDVRTGKFTVTHKMIDMGESIWTYRGSSDGVNYFNATFEDMLATAGGHSFICECYDSVAQRGTNYTISRYNIYDTSAVIYVNDSRYSADAAGAAALKTALAGVKLVYELATPFTIQLTPHEISLLKDYAYVSTNGTSIALDYHNGELASLGDVSQLGETVNELGKYSNLKDISSEFTINTTSGSGNAQLLYDSKANIVFINAYFNATTSVAYTYDIGTISEKYRPSNTIQLPGGIYINASDAIKFGNFNIYANGSLLNANSSWKSVHIYGWYTVQ